MIISDLLAYVDAVKPNSFDAPTKIIWLNEVEGMVQTDIMLVASADIITYAATDTAVALLVPAPHDKLYRSYLCAMVDFANGEYTKYNNTMQMFNAQYHELVEWYARVYRPADGVAIWQGYYISAYGIAVSHGYVGDEVAWLLTLKGETAAPGIDGIDGVAGANGTNGAVGSQGIQGVTGNTGAQGIQGVMGNTGVKGDTGNTGAQGIQGVKGDIGAGFVILGYYATLGALQAAVTTPTAGMAYGVGSAAPYDVYVYDGLNTVWVNNGAIQGAQGDTGAAGAQGIQGIQGVKGDTGTSGTTTATAVLAVVGWAANSQTPTVTGVTATNTVWVSPAPASQDAYVAAGIKCTAQGTGTLTFTCVTTPTAAITVNVILAGV